MNEQPPSSEIDPNPGNHLQLSLSDCVIVLCLCTVVLVALPRVWQSAEGEDVPSAYRIPFRSSEDYWEFSRLARATNDKVMVVGDSVVWGEYVTPGNSLTECLNRQIGESRFTNAGLSGAHPMALEGLMKNCTALSHRGVVIHCNLLWLSSRERDLSSPSGQEFNHPSLVPQLVYDVPSYHATVEQRLSILVDRHWPARSLSHHVRSNSFEGLDVPTWTLGHPYDNPLARLQTKWVQPRTESRHSSEPWTASGGRRVDFEWVDPDESRQFAAFLRLTRHVKQSGRRLVVVLGPLNEHILTDESRARYAQLKSMVSHMLRAENVTCVVPDVLPSQCYGDASHPLAAGYELLAEILMKHEVFRLL